MYAGRSVLWHYYTQGPKAEELKTHAQDASKLHWYVDPEEEVALLSHEQVSAFWPTFKTSVDLPAFWVLNEWSGGRPLVRYSPVAEIQVGGCTYLYDVC
jgi:hypothetical protein